ncbi:MAG: adenosine kinase [Acidimicrobiales bacterium]
MFDPRWPFSDPAACTAREQGGGEHLDVVCIGHALVDRLAHVPAEEVAATNIEPGAMMLVDAERAGEIDRVVPVWEQAAGGSAANTAAGVALLGGRPAFAGGVGDDELGRWYASDLEAIGVAASVAKGACDEPTGTCHVLVTPGGRRSMATHLGAASVVPEAVVDSVGIERALVLYVEGYLLDAAAAAALERALEVARASGTVVSLSLSDPFVVSRHRERISELVLGGSISLLFGNEEEICGLMGASSVTEAAARLARADAVTVITKGPSGSLAVVPSGDVFVEAEDVYPVVDTTGAGDLFAAGFLYGLTHGYGPKDALSIGSRAAGEVIARLGARPMPGLGERILSLGLSSGGRPLLRAESAARGPRA